MTILRRFVRSAAWVVVLAAFAVASCTVALAQATTGTISGTVTDTTGAAVAGATVTLTNTDRGQDLRTLTTDGAGFWTAPSLPLGTYSVKIEAKGFKTDTVTGLILHVNDSLTVNRQVAVGSSSQEVTVQADALQLNFQNADSATTISGTQIRELSLPNRNYEQLVALQPGVSYGGGDQLYIGLSNPNGETNVVSFSVNGNRNSSNNWTLDGADNVDRGSNLTLLAYPSVDAIAEFKTQRGTYSAEYGRSASGQINVITRSGTNAFHGTAYEFFRNDVLNANTYLNKDRSSVIPRSKLRYNDFGYTIGGPVWIPHVYDGRDKTFFFFSQEFRRVLTYSSFSNFGVPTQAERAGNFGSNLVCPSVDPATGNCNAALTSTLDPTTFSPLAKAYLKDVYAAIPEPSGSDGHTLVTAQRNVYDQTQEIVRIDQTFGQKLTAFFRLINDKLPTVEPGGLFSGTGYPGVQTTSTNSPGRTYLGHATYVINPRLLIDGGYAYSSGAIISDPTGQVLSSHSPDIKATMPFAVTLGRIPALTFSGGQGIGGFGPYRDYDRNKNIFVNVSKTVGQHSLRLGITWDHYQKTENAGGGNQGTFGFTNAGLSSAQLCKGAFPGTNPPCAYNYQQSFANFLMGFVTNFNQASLDMTPDIQNTSIEAYAQDDWKAAPRLTLNIGVRYSYFPQPVDKNHLLTTFDPSLFKAANAPTIDTAGSLCVAGAPCKGGVTPNPNYDALNGISINGKTSPYGQKVGKNDTLNFAPRVGFAYDVFGNGKAALRGGYGIAYDTALYGIYEQNIFANPPYVQSPNIPNTSFDDPAQGTAKLNINPPTLRGTSPNFKTPYTQQFSLDLQQQLAPSLVLDMGYFGQLGRHLLGIVDLNEVPVGAYLAAGLGSTVPGDTVKRITTGNSPTLNQIRPYKGYTSLNSIEPWFTSNYHSLQISLQKRFTGDNMVNVNYTWSKALTDNQSDRSSATQNLYNIKGDYGRAALDRRQILTADFVYELPFLKHQPGLVGRVVGGWEVSGIVSMNSGLPFTATRSDGLDPGGLGILGPSAAGPRPDQVGDPNAGPHTRLHWFNTDAFAAVPSGVVRPGNAQRGTINGPGFQRWDLALFKNFKVWEKSSFQFRAETTNTFNHTNFDSISVSSTSSLFGQVTAYRAPRVLQVGAKFRF